MYHGDIRLGSAINLKFTTRNFSTGAPFTLAGSPAISAYVGSGTVEITAGIILTVDFDSRTGLNNVRIDATSGNGFVTAADVELVITAGTVNGVSVVGEVIGSFSIENRSALMPTTAGRTAVVDAAGLIDVNTVKVGPTGGGTAQTARDVGASVLLSSGTGAGQLKLASGYVAMTWADIAAPTTTVNLSGTTVKTVTDVEADTQDIQSRLPAALTADGNIKADALRVSGDATAADNLELFFDGTGYNAANSTVGTVALVTTLTTYTGNTLQSGDAFARLGPPAGASVSADLVVIDNFVDDLETRLTAARAGYLDNLNVGGNVASSAEVLAVQNNTRVVRVVPPVIERPDSGTQMYRVELLLYDSTGNMEAPDSAPTLDLVDQGGTDLSARLDSATGALVSAGRYRWVYTASVGDDLEQLVWTFSVVEGGATRLYGNTSLIVDTTAVDFTAADRTKLESLESRLGTPSNLGSGATVAANLADIEGQTDDIGAAGSGLTAVPWNAAWDAEVRSECADALSAYDGPTNAEMEARTIAAASYALEATLTAMKGATFSGATDSLEAIRDRGDAAWITATGFSTHTAADVWASASRTLTAAGLDAVLVDGKTLPAALQIVASICAGKISGAGTGTEVFLGIDGVTTRVTVSADGSGNRTAVVFA